MSARFSTAVFILLLLCNSVAAYQAGPSQTKPSASDPGEEIERIRQRMLLTSRVYRLVDAAFNFKDFEAKTLTLIRLADIFWESEPEYAHQIFIKTYDDLKSLTPSENETTTASVETRKLRARLTYLSSMLIATLLRHDSASANRMKVIGTDTASDPTLKNMKLNSALYLLANDDTSKAVELAKQALVGDISNEAPSIVYFLRQLRSKDEATADQLFTVALARLAAQPIVDAKALMILGTYVFASSLDDGISDEPSMRIQYIRIYKYLVINLASSRLNVPVPLVKSYIDSAVDVLWRGSYSAAQKPSFYIIGYQLAPHVEHYAPELIPKLRLAMSGLISDVPRELTDPSTYAPLARPAQEPNLEGLTDYIEKMSDERLRESTYFRVAHSFFYRGDLANARKAAEKIRDFSLRSRLINLITYSETIKEISKDDLPSASEMASKMRPSTESALAWLELGCAYAAKDFQSLARDAINAALKASESADPGSPFISLMAANLMARFDKFDAFTLLRLSVKGFNKIEGSPEPMSELWRPEVQVSNVSRRFSLPRKLVNNDLRSSFYGMVTYDLQQVEEVATSLKQEPIASEAILALAAATVKEVKELDAIMKTKEAKQNRRVKTK